MKVLTDTDDEPPPLPPKVSTSPCTYTSVYMYMYIDSYSELHIANNNLFLQQSFIHLQVGNR